MVRGSWLALLLLITACTAEKVGEGGVDERNATQLPQRTAPAFSGTDQTGTTFSTDLVKGKRWIATFFFTSCTTVCPTLNEVQQRLVEEFGSKVRMVSISTDPETDTVERLAECAKRYGAKSGQWWMIRMSADSMRTLAAEGLGVMRPDEPDMHTTRLVAIDENMNVVGYYDSTDERSLDVLREWINSQL